MADQDQKEFLGGGPKFNTVGKDNRPVPGAAAEPVIAPDRTGYWLRVAGIGVLVLALAGVLFYLNDRDLGKTTLTPGHGVSPDAKNAPVPPSLR